MNLPGDADQKTPAPEELTYELPDGQIIQIDDKARYMTPEILFQPDIFTTIQERGPLRLCAKSLVTRHALRQYAVCAKQPLRVVCTCMTFDG